MKRILFFLSFLVFISSCKRENATYTKHEKGFYYHLLAFNNDLKKDNTHFIALLDMNYCTQNDSVFWNSKTDFNDKYFVNIDPEKTGNCIECYLQKANEGDSVLLLIPKDIFFKQQFQSRRTPEFTSHDSVVKVYMKIKTIFNAARVDSLITQWALHEQELIADYLKKNNIRNYYKDSLNVYWIGMTPDQKQMNSLKGKTVSMSYKGYLLNGKQFDESPEDWQVNTSTPDQMLRGLNYVIKFLNTGQNTKIILPSYLAFGELGAGNIIPPYTPLLYEININNIVN
jgi:FKBP-type peptidyl-prolyl cis-trans isomerase FkpA